MIFRYASVFYVIALTFTVVRGYTGLRDWILHFALLGLTLILYPKSFINKETFLLLMYLGVLVFFALFGHPLTDIRWIANEVFPPFMCLLIINVFLYNRDIFGLKIVTSAGLIVIVITSFLTIPILLKDSNAIRSIVEIGTANNDLSYVIKSYKKGIASFGLISSLPFIYPALIYLAKKERILIKKVLFILSIIFPYLILLKSSVATPMILSTANIFLSILITKNKILNIITFVIISILIILFLNKQLIISGLELIQPFFEKTLIESKIDDIVLSIERKEAEGSVRRSELTAMSWNAFITSPLYGTFDKKGGGGHAYFVDRLAYFGLIGTFPFVLFLYFTFNKHLALIDRGAKNYYLISIFSFFLLGTIKNIGSLESFIYLFIFLPGLCLMNNRNYPAPLPAKMI